MMVLSKWQTVPILVTYWPSEHLLRRLLCMLLTLCMLGKKSADIITNLLIFPGK